MTDAFDQDCTVFKLQVRSKRNGICHILKNVRTFKRQKVGNMRCCVRLVEFLFRKMMYFWTVRPQPNICVLKLKMQTNNTFTMRNLEKSKYVNWQLFLPLSVEKRHAFPDGWNKCRSILYDFQSVQVKVRPWNQIITLGATLPSLHFVAGIQGTE